MPENSATKYAIVFEKYEEEAKKLELTVKDGVVTQVDYDQIDEIRRLSLELSTPQPTLFSSAS